MRVILLSAGKGTRMKSLTTEKNKCLLDLGYDKNILSVALDNISKCDLKDVTIVTGYKNEQFTEYVHRYQHLNIELVYNPFYDVFGNIFSLWVANKSMNDDFVVINGDVLFHRSVLRKLLKNKPESGVCMVIDRKENYDADDMKVVEKCGKILKVGKKLEIDEVNGESIGMIRFSDSGCEKLKSVLKDMIGTSQKRNAFYLEAIQSLIKQGNTVNYVEVPEDLWLEIDFPSDFCAAKKKIEQIIG